MRASILTVAALAALAGPAAAQTNAGPDAPSAHTLKAQAHTARTAPFADRRDFELAERGFLGSRADPLIRDAAGRVVWDLSAFDFLKADAPPTVNPSLWRQSQLLAKHGLFQVTDRIYQVRGFDLANITFVKGDRGWIVIDTLTATETAKAALDLVTEKLGPRPISAVVYTHSHGDHFGGTAALVSAEDVRAGKVQVIAPEGFLEAAVGENLIAGPAMGRRAAYQFGVPLPRGPTGTISSGIGPALAVGTQSMIAPNVSITHTGQELTIDGVRMVFQLTPDTEAPAEMNLAFPDWRVVDMAENANATQHNVLTPRGAVVRDAKGWADQLTESIRLFGGSDVMIASHAWPRFGRAEIGDYLAKHRDAYAFLHDQTVRLMNDGLTGPEIAARLKLPPALEREWYDRPYYGSISFNSRAVYQRYMGWYDANPVHLAPRPPEDTAKRYVAALGGPAKVRSLAQEAYDAGDYAWAAELLDKAVFADPTDAAAKTLLARSYEQLAWQSENSLWRNMYLTGASELRNGVPTQQAIAAAQGGLVANLPTRMVFDLMSVRLDADKVGDGKVKLAFVFTDRQETVFVSVENGVLIHQPITPPGPVDATLTISRADFLQSVLGGAPLAPKVASGAAKIDGDAGALQRFASWMSPPRGNFAIVTP